MWKGARVISFGRDGRFIIWQRHDSHSSSESSLFFSPEKFEKLILNRQIRKPLGLILRIFLWNLLDTVQLAIYHQKVCRDVPLNNYRWIRKGLQIIKNMDIKRASLWWQLQVLRAYVHAYRVKFLPHTKIVDVSRWSMNRLSIRF